MLEENPRRSARRRQPPGAPRHRASHGSHPSAINAMAATSFRARRHSEIAASVGARAAVCTHFENGGKARSSWLKRVEAHRRARIPDALRRRCDVAAKIEDGGHRASTAPTGRLPAAAPASSTVRSRRLSGSGLHRQDASLALLGSQAPGCTAGWRLPCVRPGPTWVPGFVYLVSGDMRTMPGLSSSPAAERIELTRTRRRLY